MMLNLIFLLILGRYFFGRRAKSSLRRQAQRLPIHDDFLSLAVLSAECDQQWRNLVRASRFRAPYSNLRVLAPGPRCKLTIRLQTSKGLDSRGLALRRKDVLVMSNMSSRSCATRFLRFLANTNLRTWQTFQAISVRQAKPGASSG